MNLHFAGAGVCLERSLECAPAGSNYGYISKSWYATDLMSYVSSTKRQKAADFGQKPVRLHHVYFSALKSEGVLPPRENVQVTLRIHSHIKEALP